MSSVTVQIIKQLILNSLFRDTPEKHRSENAKQAFPPLKSKTRKGNLCCAGWASQFCRRVLREKFVLVNHFLFCQV